MRLLIYGSRSFAATMAAVSRESGHDVVGFIDDFATGDQVLGGLESVSQSHPPADHGLVLAIGYSNLRARWAAWTRVKAAGYFLPPIIHPAASISPSASIREGAIVMRSAIVDHEVIIGEVAVLWPGACINHDSAIGRNTFISPGATVCGDVRIGDHCFVGANATIVNGAEVPERSFIRMQEAYTGRPR